MLLPASVLKVTPDRRRATATFSVTGHLLLLRALVRARAHPIALNGGSPV